MLFLGAAVGIMTVGVWALELQLNLPDWMVRVAMIKLALIASAGLLTAGALIGRHATRGSLPQDSPPAQLGEGAAEPLKQNADADFRESIKQRRSDTPP